MSEINRVTFQAKWNDSNVHLNSSVCEIWKLSEKSFFQKVYLCFTKGMDNIATFFLSPAKKLCGSWIVPVSRASAGERAFWDQLWSEFWSGQEQSPLTAAYQASELHVTAPDGTLVKGAFYRHKRGVGQDVPTIICFGPNAQLAKSECWDWLLKKGAGTPIPFNVAVFDYRTDLVESGQCVLDGDAVVQALHEGMGISKSNLHMMGYSFGGGIGAQVADLHPDAGRYVDLRSFGSIGKVLRHGRILDGFICAARDSRMMRIAKWIISRVPSMLKWGIDIEKPLKAMGARALVVYHPRDCVIPGAASPAEWVETGRAVEMRFKRTVTISEPESLYNHHCNPLKYYEDENGLNISKRILNFVLGTQAFQRRRPEALRTPYHI